MNLFICAYCDGEMSEPVRGLCLDYCSEECRRLDESDRVRWDYDGVPHITYAGSEETHE